MKIEKVVLEKSAANLLQRAEDCFDIARSQHVLANQQHDIASQQLQNAEKQRLIGAQQHRDADNTEAKAIELDDLGHTLEADAVSTKGEAEVAQRGNSLVPK